MNLDFRSLDIESRPTLILETLDFTPIAPIGDAYGLRADIKYNEVSEIEFTVPHFVDGHENEYFDEIQSMRVVEVSGLGRFRLVSPNITIDGLTEVKVCKGYSLEYELSQKILNLGNGTYNLWNPLKQDNTILGMFMKDFPAWRVMHEHDGVIGIDISASLVDRYRTFEVSDNWYNFMKSTAQQSYQCVFEFDPFERIIKVRAAKDDARQLPIMIAPENLAKEIQVEELSDEIYTCFDVNGADGVDIRSVNPTGTNKIYNLSYYMNEKNFSPELISKYNEWNEKILSVRDSYYSYSIQRANAYLELEMAKAEYTALQGEYTTQENLYSVAAQAELSGVSGADKSVYRAKMEEIRQKILAKEAQIKSIQARIDTLQNTLDATSNQLAFETYFADELVLLSPYIKESVMSESTFVATNTATYGETGALLTGNLFDIIIKDSSVVDCTNAGSDNGILATDSTIKTYRADGGSVEIKCATLNDDGTKTDVIITGSVQHAVYNIHTKDNRLIGSVVFQKTVTNDDGSTDDVTATLTVVRDDFNESMLDVKTTYDYESEDLEYDYTGHMNLNELTNATLYLTSESTEFQRSNVQWELYDYAWELLEKSAYPSYSFTVDAANFLALSDFVAFKNNFELGQRTYLQLREGYVLSPIVVGASFEYDNPESLTLEFANQFNSNSGEFGLIDLLEQSVSIGSTVDTSKFAWNQFEDSKASTVIGDFMKSEIDLMLNRIKASSDQDIEINGSGIHLRMLKSADFDGFATDENGNYIYDDIVRASEYDPHQIWMSNDAILFTDDGWQTCKMAIGKGSLGYGIIADYLVGTFVASKNLAVTNTAGTVTINETGMVVDGMNFVIKHSDDDPGQKLIDILDSSSSFAQATIPAGPGDGDLWYVSGENDVIDDHGTPEDMSDDITYKHGKWYRFDGAVWTELTDGDLAAIITTDPNGEAKVALGSVRGVINTTVEGMQSTVGNLYMDETGLWLIDTDNPTTAKKAVWMNGSGILISSSRTKSDSNCPSYNENTGKSFDWGTAISATGVAATEFIGESIFGEIELGIGATTEGGFSDNHGNKWNFYVNKNGKLQANGAEVKGDIYCSKLFVDGETDIKSLLKAIQNNVTDLGEQKSLGLSNTNLDIQFKRSGDIITHVGGGITFTDVSSNPAVNAGSFGAVVAASGRTGLGLKTLGGYPIVIDSGSDISINAESQKGIYIGQGSKKVDISSGTSAGVVSIGKTITYENMATNETPTTGEVIINGHNIVALIKHFVGSSSGTAVYA